jgi:hypothetical protein
MNQRLAGQKFFIAMPAINGREISPSPHNLSTHINSPGTDRRTGPAKQAAGKNIFIGLSMGKQVRPRYQMEFAPGGMALLSGDPINRADNRAGSAFSAGIHGDQLVA